MAKSEREVWQRCWWRRGRLKAFPIMLWSSYPLKKKKKGCCTPTRCQELCKPLDVNGKYDRCGPSLWVPQAKNWSLRERMRKFPNPQELKKNPRAPATYTSSSPQCLQKRTESAISPLVDKCLLPPGGARRFRSELPPASFPSLRHSESSLVPSDQTEIPLVQLPGQTHKDQAPREMLRATPLRSCTS